MAEHHFTIENFICTATQKENMEEEIRKNFDDEATERYSHVCLKCAWERDYSPQKEKVCLIVQNECPIKRLDLYKSPLDDLND